MAKTFAEERRLKLFIYARVLVSFILLVSAVYLQKSELYSEWERHQSGLIQLMAFSFLFSLSSLITIEFYGVSLFQAYLQVIWDLLFVSVFVLFTGGILSPYSFLYIFSIMIAGMLLGRRQALYTASLCGILYGAILDFQYFGYLAIIGLSQEDAQQFGASRLLYTIAFNLIAFALTAFITALSAERAQASEDALLKTTVNYAELTKLSSAIVAHSESGILTTTVEGKIRLFNPYAEIVTGLSQNSVYDHDINSVLPGLFVNNSVVSQTTSGEIEFTRPTGESVILGFRIAQFTDSNDNLSGFIVNFRDITELRSMKQALKKADRLAAVGELSARMAHEIRNPLASLCGSVQLLSSNISLPNSDRKLLTIVAREASRLENLISEFLLYARPAAPERELINVSSYIDDVLLPVANDPKFARIILKNDVQCEVEIFADSHQLRQVLLNLLHNSADAMPEGGTIVIQCHIASDSVSLSITDDGCGIPEDSLQHLFEPFWTTKPAGSGLGLAICFRIIQAHEGYIAVESSSQQGSRFVITLPNIETLSMRGIDVTQTDRQ